MGRGELEAEGGGGEGWGEEGGEGGDLYLDTLLEGTEIRLSEGKGRGHKGDIHVEGGGIGVGGD